MEAHACRPKRPHVVVAAPELAIITMEPPVCDQQVNDLLVIPASCRREPGERKVIAAWGCVVQVGALPPPGGRELWILHQRCELVRYGRSVSLQHEIVMRLLIVSLLLIFVLVRERVLDLVFSVRQKDDVMLFHHSTTTFRIFVGRGLPSLWFTVPARRSTRLGSMIGSLPKNFAIPRWMFVNRARSARGSSNAQ